MNIQLPATAKNKNHITNHLTRISCLSMVHQIRYGPCWSWDHRVKVYKTLLENLACLLLTQLQAYKWETVTAKTAMKPWDISVNLSKEEFLNYVRISEGRAGSITGVHMCAWTSLKRQSAKWFSLSPFLVWSAQNQELTSMCSFEQVNFCFYKFISHIFIYSIYIRLYQVYQFL